jgi:hypothetical protein
MLIEVCLEFISTRIKKGESRTGKICHAKTMIYRKPNNEALDLRPTMLDVVLFGAENKKGSFF